MNEQELLLNSYTIRSKFINDLTNIITNIKDKSLLPSLYELYYSYLDQMLDPEYKNLFDSYYESISKIKKFPRNKNLANKYLFTLIYEMVTNINNAYLSLMYEYGHEDAGLFFSGYTIYESELDIGAIKDDLICNAPNDLEIVELLDSYNEDELNYLIERKYIDIYLLSELSNYVSPFSSVIFYERFILIFKQIKNFKDEPIYNFIIKVLKQIKQ